MDSSLILQYLNDKKFPGIDMYTVNLYGNDVIPCWLPCKDLSTLATTNTTNNVIHFDKTQPRNGTIDETKVAVRTIMLRHAVNKCDTDILLKMNYRHPAFIEQEDALDILIEAAGGIGGSFATIPKFYNGSLNAYSFRYDETSLLLHPSFIKTLMHINGENILNGVQTIPQDLCIQSNLCMDNETLCYYAVPTDHILAWTLITTHEQRIKSGNYAEELFVTDRLLYYLVPDWCFMKIYNDFSVKWLGKVHIVSMYDLAVTFVPKIETPNLKQVDIQLSFSFTGSEKSLTPEIIQTMAPVTDPNFPLYRHFIRQKTENSDYEKSKLTKI